MGTNEQRVKVRHDEQFKRSAVELFLSSGKAAGVIAQELGIHPWNLKDWKKRYRPEPAAPRRSVAEVEAENRALREELQRVKNQRDILKKTLGIISAPPDGGLNA
jgi:transposase